MAAGENRSAQRDKFADEYNKSLHKPTYRGSDGCRWRGVQVIIIISIKVEEFVKPNQSLISKIGTRVIY